MGLFHSLKIFKVLLANKATLGERIVSNFFFLKMFVLDKWCFQWLNSRLWEITSFFWIGIIQLFAWMYLPSWIWHFCCLYFSHLTRIFLKNNFQNLCIKTFFLGKNMRGVSNLHIATLTSPIISLNAFFDDSSRSSTKKRKTIMLESSLLPYEDV